MNSATENILVSIIMPMFNSEKFVGKTVTSLIEQTFENWELVVIDDGSTDSSAEIIKNFESLFLVASFTSDRYEKMLLNTLIFSLITGE